MSSLDPHLISRAIVLWTGWETSSWPVRDESALAKEFGSDLAMDLLPVLRAVENDFYSTNARLVAKSPADMANLAESDFRGKHPELSREAVEALVWSYTYDFR